MLYILLIILWPVTGIALIFLGTFLKVRQINEEESQDNTIIQYENDITTEN